MHHRYLSSFLAISYLVGSMSCNAKKEPAKDVASNDEAESEAEVPVPMGLVSATTIADAKQRLPASLQSKNSSESPKSANAAIKEAALAELQLSNGFFGDFSAEIALLTLPIYTVDIVKISFSNLEGIYANMFGPSGDLGKDLKIRTKNGRAKLKKALTNPNHGYQQVIINYDESEEYPLQLQLVEEAGSLLVSDQIHIRPIDDSNMAIKVIESSEITENGQTYDFLTELRYETNAPNKMHIAFGWKPLDDPDFRRFLTYYEYDADQVYLAASVDIASSERIASTSIYPRYRRFLANDRIVFRTLSLQTGKQASVMQLAYLPYDEEFDEKNWDSYFIDNDLRALNQGLFLTGLLDPKQNLDCSSFGQLIKQVYTDVGVAAPASIGSLPDNLCSRNDLSSVIVENLEAICFLSDSALFDLPISYKLPGTTSIGVINVCAPFVADYLMQNNNYLEEEDGSYSFLFFGEASSELIRKVPPEPQFADLAENILSYPSFAGGLLGGEFLEKVIIGEEELDALPTYQ